ncbi:hypothetical protein [Streptomyces sp. JJ38]|uniref:hypothetical protein n=1 Tax=Streptomyces sp. JJ38 TaxID=2738128 RepID=UPI001C599303|nr:hypothetical protein [Streptomyces sp. JJ38]MBW1600428.1 hypothetical protein [Streptomyces sp. JJ38]
MGDQRGAVKRGTWETVAVAVALVVALPVAVWWLVGQRDYEGLPESELDYAVRPWDIDPTVEFAVGLNALLIAVGAAALLVAWSRTRRLPLYWWSAVGPLLAAGVVAALGHRVLTAGTVGANIGAGLVAVLGTTLVLVLLAVGLGRGLYLLRRPPR